MRADLPDLPALTALPDLPALTALARVRRELAAELPAELPPERVTVLCDPREQLPWDLAPLRMVRQTLHTADYAVAGAEHLCRLERKTLQDFVACCGVERERFTRELERLLAFPSRIVIIEASLADLSAGQWRSRINSAAVIGSIASWSAMGIAFMFADDREAAQQLAAKVLYAVAKRQWTSARKLVGRIAPPADAQRVPEAAGPRGSPPGRDCVSSLQS